MITTRESDAWSIKIVAGPAESSQVKRMCFSCHWKFFFKTIRKHIKQGAKRGIQKEAKHFIKLLTTRLIYKKGIGLT